MQVKLLKKGLYSKKGQVENVVGSIIALIVGVGVATLVLIFVGVLGGQVYQQSEAQIDAITNVTIRNHIKGGVVAGFDALETTGTYLPIIVLAVVIFLVLALVLGFTNIGAGFGGGRGSVL